MKAECEVLVVPRLEGMIGALSKTMFAFELVFLASARDLAQIEPVLHLLSKPARVALPTCRHSDLGYRDLDRIRRIIQSRKVQRRRKRQRNARLARKITRLHA